MNTPSVTNSPVLWIAALGVFAVIAVQSIVYFRAAKRAAPAADMTDSELKTAFRAGAVSAIGPSLAVVLVAITLLTVFGTPVVLVRIGLIGSAGFETVTAQTAAQSAGVELGSTGYDNATFALVFFTMSVAGAAWMVSTLIFVPLLSRADRRIRKLNPAVMTIVPGAAMIAGFSYLGLTEVRKSGVHLAAFLTGALVMMLLQVAAVRLRRTWLKEWSVGISVAAALGAAAIAL
ncbi:flagellar biosynthesis protein FlhB [Prauserella isguenensis]|uniref:Flagellar biosynthesis protein FlhB n=1 Tax=Prauserella isguenensis TaxID=1470180 RepID=A0A839S2P9_9PSEU|nr:DUF5058 family protein [Prauserella isguenensis]MBB3051029.1 flagellar biosynthesis protein FlhB [Prauserella isguenensis]